MSAPTSRAESPAVTLVSELVVVAGLFFVSAIALTGAVWRGLLVGGVEVVVARRVAPPAGARSLRWVTAAIGLVTLAFTVVRAIAS